jgi:hypothetical protein
MLVVLSEERIETVERVWDLFIRQNSVALKFWFVNSGSR